MNMRGRPQQTAPYYSQQIEIDAHCRSRSFAGAAALSGVRRDPRSRRGRALSFFFHLFGRRCLGLFFNNGVEAWDRFRRSRLDLVADIEDVLHVLTSPAADNPANLRNGEVRRARGRMKESPESQSS